MPTKKITITLDDSIINGIDTLVRQHKYKSRSKAIQLAVSEYLKKLEKQKLYAEIDKLDKKEEMILAEDSLKAVNEIWDEY